VAATSYSYSGGKCDPLADHMEIYPTARRMSDGQLCIRFEGGMFRTMLGKLVNHSLTKQAQALKCHSLPTDCRDLKTRHPNPARLCRVFL
jgi:hypothetical protein